ncbi:hypothetical protein [Rhizobium leguminosarum]|uniref:hypothetical protein n=1 Tax=Rhizobium leguminosarum TaxID=384 RepID=UPI003CFC6DAD
MHHPEFITHHSSSYSLKHLWKRDDVVAWRRTNGAEVNFQVRTTFADHCYTDEQLPIVDGCYTVPGKTRARVFCTDRYARSLQLPVMISGLMQRPGKSVAFTQAKNWMTMALSMTPPLAVGDRYYIFFHVRDRGTTDDGNASVTVHVESAYAKQLRIDVKRNAPFGRVLEEFVFGT